MERPPAGGLSSKEEKRSSDLGKKKDLTGRRENWRPSEKGEGYYFWKELINKEEG